MSEKEPTHPMTPTKRLAYKSVELLGTILLIVLIPVVAFLWLCKSAYEALSAFHDWLSRIEFLLSPEERWGFVDDRGRLVYQHRNRHVVEAVEESYWRKRRKLSSIVELKP